MLFRRLAPGLRCFVIYDFYRLREAALIDCLPAMRHASFDGQADFSSTRAPKSTAITHAPDLYRLSQVRRASSWRDDRWRALPPPIMPITQAYGRVCSATLDCRDFTLGALHLCLFTGEVVARRYGDRLPFTAR